MADSALGRLAEGVPGEPADGVPVVEAAPPTVITVTMEADVIHARGLAAAMATRIGFGPAATHRLATAVSELGQNLVAHAQLGGRLSLSSICRGEDRGVEVVAEDDGPGIADLDLAMTDGFSSNRGLGGGLPGCRRLMDEFALCSTLGTGTRVTARLWLPRIRPLGRETAMSKAP